MAVRGVVPEEERKSYGTVFFVGSILLVVLSLWVVLDDTLTRRVWKRFQAEFYRIDYERAAAALEEEIARLEADPKYRELTQALEAEQESIESGAQAERLEALLREQEEAIVNFNDRDQEVKFVKSELEEAWYEYDHGVQQGRDVGPYKRRIEELEDIRASLEPGLEEARKKRAEIAAEIRNIEKGVRNLQDELYQLEGEKRQLERVMDNATTNIGPDFKELPKLRIYKIPRIEQVVLKDFDRNNFDQMVDRVDRCQSCHIAINRPGFDDVPNPLRTHPQRELLLADSAHPTIVYGCSTCHQGQGAAVNSVAQAHGIVKYWEEPLLTGEMVQSSCITCHLNVKGLKGAETVARAQTVFEQIGCTGCHLVQGYEDIPKVGPSLRKVAAKVDPSWMVRWILNPREFRPRTRMPYFYLEQDQAVAMAAYLLSVSKKEGDEWLKAQRLPDSYSPGDAERAARGKERVESIGCRGCHGFAEGEFTTRIAGKDLVPNLKDIAAKVDPLWVYSWIKNPKSYNAHSYMPSLRLSDEEALDITTYLMTLGKKAAPLPGLDGQLSAPENIKQGEALVRKYGCFGCHDIPGMEQESRIGVELTIFGSKPLEELFFGNLTQIPRTWAAWTANKLHAPRSYATDRVEQLMPHFDLAKEDIDALLVLLQGFVEREVPEFYKADHSKRTQDIVKGWRLVQQYNCVGCHVIENEGGFVRKYYEDSPSLAPPILNGEGEKVQGNWLFAFLQNPTPIRPWLKIRMPTFGFSREQADELVNFFDGLSKVEIPYVYFDEKDVPEGYLEAGRKLFSNEYFECGNCHQQGEKKPEGPVEDWAPDLNLARQRLNPAWIEKWIRDPQKLQPGTKMPSFYPGGPDDIFGGDEAKQIEALTDYIMSLGAEPEVMAKAEGQSGARETETPAENSGQGG